MTADGLSVEVSTKDMVTLDEVEEIKRNQTKNRCSYSYSGSNSSKPTEKSTIHPERKNGIYGIESSLFEFLDLRLPSKNKDIKEELED
jgi:hypothetical protein